MTIVSKKTITVTTIIPNNPSCQHTLNKLVINCSTIQLILCLEWCMHLTQLSNAIWYHSLGYSLSVSTRHSHLGKLGNKCQCHPVLHRQLPPMVINLSPKEFPNWVTCPQVQVFFLMENYKYSLTKFILFSCNYEVWNMDTINALAVDS